MVFQDENKLTVDVYFHDCFDVFDVGQTVVAYLKIAHILMTHILMNWVVFMCFKHTHKSKVNRGNSVEDREKNCQKDQFHFL